MKLIQSGTFNKQQTRRPSDLIQTLYFLVRALISERLSASVGPGPNSICSSRNEAMVCSEGKTRLPLSTVPTSQQRLG